MSKAKRSKTPKRTIAPGCKPVCMELDAALWRRAKIEAAKREMTVKALVEQALRDLLAGSRVRVQANTEGQQGD